MTKLEEFHKWCKENLREEEFYYGSFVKSHENNCGTICCLAGWLPKYDPRNWKWLRKNRFGMFIPLYKVHPNSNGITDVISNLQEYFDLTREEVKHLFYPYNQFEGKGLPTHSSLEKVLANMKEFIDSKQ